MAQQSNPKPKHQVLDNSLGWREWLSKFFPRAASAPMPDGGRHARLWNWFEGLEPGVCPAPRGEYWPRGGAKCILSSMDILCADGTRVPIRDISIGQEILSFNEVTGHFEKDVISQKWEGGSKPCLTIRTRTGKYLTLTPEHRVLTFNGWKTAAEITCEDRIASPRRTPVEGTEQRSDEEVRLVAYLLAEGTTARGGCQFTNADSAIVEDFILCAEAMGFWVKKGARYAWSLQGKKSGAYRKGAEVSALRRWLTEHGMTGCGALTKRFPDFIFRLPERQKWMFLAAFIDTDGWIQADKARIGITLANRAMIEDLAYLWAQVGVSTSVYEKPNKCAGAWALHVDQDCGARCADNLPLLLKGEKLKLALKTSRYSLLDTYPKEVCRNLPAGVNRKLRNAKTVRLGTPYDVTRNKIRRALEEVEIPRWRWLEEADVFWDKVVSIEDAGVQKTFDVEVAKNHNLITNLLVSHNSSTAELACVRLGNKIIKHDGEVRPARRFVLYVSGTQTQANKHVEAIRQKFEDMGVGREVGKYGHSRGWTVDLLRTETGFNVLALGLDAAARGVKLDDFRPDLIILDDVDARHERLELVQKKVETITESILPSGSTDCAILFIQNLIHADSIASQLEQGRADFLLEREQVPAEPAVFGLEYQAIDGVYRITAGEASWPGQSLETCEKQLNLWGRAAFLREAQHQTDIADDGAWQEAWIEKYRITHAELPPLVRVVVGVDPSGGAGQWGIVAKGKAMLGKLPHYYVLKDATPKVGTSSGASADAALDCYEATRADAFAVEDNYGGDMAETILRSAAKQRGMIIRIIHVHATRGKAVRAEPVAELAEKGYEHHVGYFTELEREKRKWKSTDKHSPNRLDADVWATTELAKPQRTREQPQSSVEENWGAGSV